MSEEAKPRTLWHQSGVNPRGEPFVQLFVDNIIVGQFTPEEAREHARSMLESAEASEQDAFMFDFHTKKIGADPPTAMRIILEFRKFREERGKKGPYSDRREFIDPNKSERI